MIDYSQSIIDIRKALLKFEHYTNKRQWQQAKNEVLKIKSSTLILNKILDEHVSK